MKNKKYLILFITFVLSFLGLTYVKAVTGSGTKGSITITGTNQPQNDISFCGDSKNGKGRPAYLPTYKYNAKDPNFSNISQTSYCIQRGRSGPDGSTWTYTTLDNFDISTCKSSSDNYQCGLAEIMCQTMDIGVGADGKFTANENNKYSYSSVATALRMWVAYDHASIHDGDGIKDNTNQGEYYYSNTDVYEKSAKYYLDNGGDIKQCPSSCASGSDEYGVFCYQSASSDEKQHIQGAIDLVTNTKNGGLSCLNNLTNTLYGNQDGEDDPNNISGNVSYGKPGISLKFNKESQIADVKVRFDKMKVGTTLISSVENDVTIPVTYCDKEAPGCNVIIQVFDAKGNELKAEGGIPSSCKKNYCDIKYKYEQICKESENNYQDQYLTVKVTLYVDKSALGGGGVNALIKNYVRANGELSQQFINFDIQGLQDLMNGKLTQGSGNQGDREDTESELVKGPIYTVKGSPVCPCNNKNRCDDFKVVNTLPDKCTNYGDFNQGLYDTYDEGKLEEPYMNCIMNACNVSQRNQYDFSSDYGVNTEVCRVFCREEVEFYLANKTRVYAGMQFKYKIDEVPGVAKKRKLKNGNSLTSMVLQKRQCATEIYYDHTNPLYNYGNSETWQTKYKKALEDLMKKWDEWKKWESLHKQALWECLIAAEGNDGIYSKGGTCAKDTGGSCSSCSLTGQKIEEVKYWYKWPIARGEPNGNRYHKYNLNNYKVETKSGSNKITANLQDLGIVSTSHTSGSPNQISSCSSYCCEEGTRKNSEGETETYCKRRGRQESGSCVQGEEGEVCDVQSKEASASKEFKEALDKITQLVYDLQNCNLYTNGEIDVKYAKYNYDGYKVSYIGEYKKATSKGTTKDYILSLANCTTEKGCISLDLEYDDVKYGAETTFGKEVEIIKQSDDIKKQEDSTYYCVNAEQGEKSTGNSYKTTCYPGPGNTDVDLNSGNQKGQHTWLGCKSYQDKVKCEKEDLQWPINDFAIFTVVSEADFWQPKRYSTEVYTGNVFESGSSYGASTTSLPPYVFPVSMDKESGGKTGAYDVKHRYSYVGSALSKAQLLNENYYEFTCQYEVYNITNLYDCNVGTDANNNANLETCNNKCYEVKDGAPIIRDCSSWNNRTNDSKGYGFIYRNVELGKLFPAPRKVGNNWLIHESEQKAIEATASDMYTDSEKYLEYSFILNSDSIKKLRKYNKDRNGAGGYVDNTLRGCTITDGFYNCSSSFLDLIRDDSNSFGIKVNKSDGMSEYKLEG